MFMHDVHPNIFPLRDIKPEAVKKSSDNIPLHNKNSKYFCTGGKSTKASCGILFDNGLAMAGFKKG